MYLGGEVITPDLCDYESYKLLGLKCAFCQSPVFLRQGSEYQQGEKSIKRDACFAHFKANAEQSELCEAKALTKAGKEEIEAIKRKQRNQRMRLYQQQLVRMLTISRAAGEISVSSLRKSMPITARQSIDNAAKKNLNLFKTLCQGQIKREKNIGQILDECNSWRNLRGKEQVNLQIKLDLVFQETVLSELFQHLARFCSQKQLADFLVIYLSLFSTTYGEKKAVESFHSGQCFYEIINSFLIQDWKKAIALVLQCKSRDFAA
jgi:hypothetical protein